MRTAMPIGSRFRIPTYMSQVSKSARSSAKSWGLTHRPEIFAEVVKIGGPVRPIKIGSAFKAALNRRDARNLRPCPFADTFRIPRRVYSPAMSKLDAQIRDVDAGPRAASSRRLFQIGATLIGNSITGAAHPVSEMGPLSVGR